MSDPRITVWVQRFKDRPTLMLQWLDPDTGKRKSQSARTSDQEEAETARADKEYELNHGLHKEISRMSWARFRELFEAEYFPSCRQRTRESYQNTFRLFEEVCSPRTLRAVNERTVSAFATGMRKLRGRLSPDGMASSTIHVNLCYLHSALSWAVEQKLLPTCPTFPSVKVPKKRPQPVAVEAFERLLAATGDDQIRAFLLSGWLAGLRRNEALALQWEPSDKVPWVDLARNRIWLPAEFVKAVEDQWVALDPKLREVLEALPRTGKKVFHILHPVTGEHQTPSYVSKAIEGLARKAGVRLSMRSLRRGFGCRYAGKVPAQVLQRLMRHANIATTMTFYANVDDAAEEAILGPKRNSMRNSQPVPDGNATREGDTKADQKSVCD
jgi:integrase